MRLLRSFSLPLLLVSAPLFAQNASVSVALQRPDPNAAVAGTTLVFDMFANNEGPANASNAVVNTAVPLGATLVSMSVPAGWSCPTLPPSGGTGAIQCTTATLVPGSETLVLSVTTPPNFPNGSTITLTATISTSTPDPDPNDNSDSLTLPVIWQTNLSVAKSGPSTAASGATVSYTISVTNPGPSYAADLTLTDALPSQFRFVGLSAPGWTCTTPAAGASGTVQCTMSQLAITTSAITLQVNTLSSFAGGTVTNGVTLTASSDASTRTASAATTMTPSADLAVTKVAASSSVVAGTDASYTITLTNNGPSDASSVVLTDVLPSQTQFVSFSAPAGWSCTTGSTISCSAPSLAAGASAQFLLSAQLSRSIPSGMTVTNTASASSSTSDPTPSNNSGSATITTASSADIALIAFSDSPSPVNAGAALTYTVQLTNQGPSDAPSASLTIPLPSALTFTSVTAPAGWTCTTPAAGSGGTVSCTFPFLPYNAVASFTVVTNVRPTTPPNTLIVTTATATSATDTNPANGSFTTSTPVRSPATVTGTKSVSGRAFETLPLTYTIVLTNSGPSEQFDNPGDELVDVLPSSLTLVSASASSGTALANVATNTVTWNGAIPVGGSVTITIVATINTGTAGQPITNTATIHFDADGNGTNESTATATSPAVTPAPAAQIPALSMVGLMALALALAIVGVRR